MEIYYFETRFTSLKNELRNYLKENDIYYELSGAIADYHFAIQANENQAEKINAFLDSVTI